MNLDILTEDQVAQLSHLISSSQNIVITCHRSPDGDAIGSSLGFAAYLWSLGKEVSIIVPDQFPDFLAWLPNTEKIIRYDKHKEKCDMLLKIADVVFCLDFNTLSIVWQLGGFEMQTKHFATPVYCGMMTDTGGFQFNSTKCEIYFIISQLLTKNIDKDKIYRNVYHNYSENRLRLMGYVMYEKLVYLKEYNASYYAITKEDQKRFNFIKGDAEGLVNIPQQIKGLKLSISMREDTDKENTIWISLRSVDDFPCNEMAAQFFNGGGHLNASGGRLNCTIEEAIEITKKAIEAYADRLI